MARKLRVVVVVVVVIAMTSLTLLRMTDFDEIWYADGKPHADDSEKVKIETGSRISMWRPFVFRNRK